MPIPIRCLNNKRHGIFSHCGSLLGAVDEDAVYLHCSTCSSKNGVSKWVKVTRDENDGIIITQLPPNTKLSFEDTLALVE
jgi:hypothetical protein